MLRVRSHILHISTYRIQLPPLFMHNMRHVPEKLVQLSDTLLDIPYFRLSFYNE